jgi:ATP/maltotriose-dependent transcriptional regulator MalT
VAADLLARDAAVGAIDRLLARARTGSGGTLALIGEAGLGKTALLELAAARAADLDTVLCRGEPDEQGLAYGLVDQLELGLGDRLPDRVVEQSGRHHRLLRAMQARAGRPLLLLVDDLHWADADSLAVFGFLVRRAAGLGLTTIAALRAWPAPAIALADQLAGAGLAEEHRLEPLDASTARQLLVQRTGAAVPQEVADRAWEITGGNPLLLTQVAHVIESGGELPTDGAGSSRLGTTLLLARFSGLDRPGVAFARAASVLGVQFRVDVAAAVAADTADLEADAPGAVDRAVETLERNGLLVMGEGGLVRFAHPLFAQALYEDTPPALRARMHARALAALADRGLESEAAEHAARSGQVGDGRVIALLRRVAANAFAAGAVVSAIQSLEVAVALSGDRPAADLLLEQAQALVADGRLVEAADTCERLLADPGLDRLVRCDGLRLLGRTRYLTGAPDRGDAAFAEAIALAEAEQPAAAVDALLDQSLTSWLLGGTARALPYATRARELARSAPGGVAALAEAAWGHLALEGGADGGVVVGQRSADTAREYVTGARPLDVRTLSWPWAPVYHAGMDAAHLERLEEAEEVLTFARGRAEEAGAPTGLATLSIHLANVLVRRGRLADALAQAVRAEEFAELTPGVTPYAQSVRAEALAWLGRFDESEEACRTVEASAPGQWFAELWCAHVRGMRQLWTGDPAASDTLLRAEQLTRASGIREPCHLHWAGHAMVAHARVGRLAEITALLEWLEECAAVLPCHWPRIAVGVGRAELALAQGRLAEAEAASAEALRLHEAVELPLLRVEALLWHGELLRRTGRAREARPHLAGAAELAGSLGAAELAARASTELHLSGGRRRVATAAPGELTAAERRVALLAADGRTNAEIAAQLYLSVNTVETHLKRVYTKLAIGSRRELMRLPAHVLATSESPGSVTTQPS